MNTDFTRSIQRAPIREEARNLDEVTSHDHTTEKLQEKQSDCAATMRQAIDRDELLGFAVGGAIGTIIGTLTERVFFGES